MTIYLTTDGPTTPPTEADVPRLQEELAAFRGGLVVLDEKIGKLTRQKGGLTDKTDELARLNKQRRFFLDRVNFTEELLKVATGERLPIETGILPIAQAALRDAIRDKEQEVVEMARTASISLKGEGGGRGMCTIQDQRVEQFFLRYQEYLDLFKSLGHLRERWAWVQRAEEPQEEVADGDAQAV
jgi:hypothetical protein